MRAEPLVLAFARMHVQIKPPNPCTRRRMQAVIDIPCAHGLMPYVSVFCGTKRYLKKPLRCPQNAVFDWLIRKIRPHRLGVEIVSRATVLFIPVGAAISVNGDH